jgi:hypothetical protein
MNLARQRSFRSLFAGLAIAALAAASQAGAATYTIEATGELAETTFDAFVAGSRSYQTGRLILDVQGGLPFELVDGDTIEFSISLDGFFGVPASAEQFFGVNFDGAGDQQAAGASNTGSILFENSGLAVNPVGAGCSNCLSVIYFGGNAQAFQFDGLTGSTVVTLTSPYTVEQLSISYQVSEPFNAVPEPAAWAMMIAGFGLVGGLARRRATRANLA